MNTKGTTTRPMAHTAASVILAVAVSASALGQESTTERERDIARMSKLKQQHRQEQLAYARRLFNQFQGHADETTRLLEQLVTTAESFSQHLEALMTSDEGKRLAADRELRNTFIQLYEDARPAIHEITIRRDAAKALCEQLAQQVNTIDVGYLPKENLREEVGENFFWAKEWLAQLNQQQSQFRGLLARVPKDRDVTSLKTLRAELDAREMAWIAFQAAADEEGVTLAQAESKQILVDAAHERETMKSLEEARRQLREARVANERLRLDYELRIQRLENEMERDRQESETRHQDLLAELERAREEARVNREVADIEARLGRVKKLDAARKKELIAKAHSPEVKQLLAPFLAKGYCQPGKNSGRDLLPVSLSALRETGALQPTVKGLTILHRLGTKRQEDKERPRWGYRSYFDRMPPEERQELQRAQNYLIELGDIMVEEGLLAP